eukprot:5290564-Alexandrium_andersonii.AAC.1
MFGCDISPMPSNIFRGFTTALKEIAAVGCASIASPALVFGACGKRAPDPARHLLIKRVRSLRLQWHKHRKVREAFAE